MKPAFFTSLFQAVQSAVVQGMVLGALLFVAEVLVGGRHALGALGAPLPAIAGVYVALGVVVGALAGALAGFAGWPGRLAPARLSLPPLAWSFGALFVLRAVPASNLTEFPLRSTIVLAGAPLAVTTAFLWARGARGTRGKPHRRWGLAFGTTLLAVVVPVVWQAVSHRTLPARRSTASDAPNIVFILVDALRQDRVSCFGYARDTTPNVDRLAHSGLRFTNTYAHGNRTIISMPALFTSLYPALTGAYGVQDEMSPLPEARTTLAELCRDAGYTTFAMMSNPYLKRPFGLTQGFDRVEEFNGGRFGLSVYRLLMAAGLVARPHYAHGTTASATEVTDAALSWISRAPREAPYFCYLHYMDAHHPYLPPAEFERMFRSRDELATIDPEELFVKTVDLVRAGTPYPLEPDELQRLSDLYDGSIRYVDTEIGRLLDAIDRADNGRPTVVVFTSDHGDEFQEHGCLYHNNVVIQELIRVPLVLWRSDRTFGREVVDLVRHVDVLPTLAELIGVEAPMAAMGRSLVPVFTGGALPAVASIAEGDHCSALVEPGWKVMHVDTSGADALFDLSADPWGKADVSGAHPGRLDAMLELLDGYLRAVEPFRQLPSATANAETIRQLESLGYVN